MEKRKMQNGKKRKRENTKWNLSSKPIWSSDCSGFTSTVLFATEALKHVAKCLSGVPSSHIPTQLSVGLSNVSHMCDGPPVTRSL